MSDRIGLCYKCGKFYFADSACDCGPEKQLLYLFSTWLEKHGLQFEIDLLNSAIDTKDAKIARLKAEIERLKAEIDRMINLGEQGEAKDENK